MRNIYIQIDQGSRLVDRNANLGLTAGETKEILKAYSEAEDEHGKAYALFLLITDVFYMGLAVGYRFANRERDKNKPKL